MRKLLLTAAVLAGLCVPAGAVEFTLSDGHGSGPFGSVTGFFLNAQDTAYVLHFDMAPNYIIDTGGHYSMTISLNTGTIVDTATTFAGLGLPGSPYVIQPHTDPAAYANDPFRFFTDAVAGNCPNTPGNGGCGSDLWIEVTGVDPLAIGGLFNPATQLFNGFQVWAAVDIFQLSSGTTFVVGLADQPTIGPACADPPCTTAVPGPLVGAGIPGLMTMSMVGLAWWRRRRSVA